MLKEETTRLVNTPHALRDEWTVITGDQATYELALAIRENHRGEFSNVVLLLGGFHQAHNYLKAICKIMRASGGEYIIVSVGLCSDGTAKKVFGEKADYYQSMHVIIILSEAVWRLYWEAFESWTAERDTTKWQGAIEDVLKSQLDRTVYVSEQLASIQTCHPQVVNYRNSRII